MIKFEQLKSTQPLSNLNNAFDVAERELGIARLLDAEGKLDTFNDFVLSCHCVVRTYVIVIFSQSYEVYVYYYIHAYLEHIT